MLSGNQSSTLRPLNEQSSWVNPLKLLLELSSDIIICLTPDYHIIEVSLATQIHYASEKSQLIGQHYLDWCRVNHVSIPLLKQLQKIPSLKDFNFDHIQEIIPTEDCQSVWVVAWSGRCIFDEDRQPCGLIIYGKKLLRPIFTEAQNNTLSYLDNIINAIPGSVYCKDKKGVYLLCNNIVLEKGNLKNKASIIGKTDFDVWPQHAETLRQHDKEVVELGKTLNLEETVVLPDGKKMYFASVKMPLKDKLGNIVGVVGNSLDITELKEAKEKAEQANIIKTEFIHNMEHDIRTPFSGIYALAQLMHEEETDPQKKECLGEIAQAGKELLDFCNTILDFTKIEMGTLPILHKKFNLSELLEKVIAMERPAALYKNLFLCIECTPDLPVCVVGDDHRLLRILINLLSNSIKFTQKGHISLYVNAIRSDDKKIILQFSVKDTGSGIPEEKQTFIYEKFSRLTPSNKNRYSGIGLGLRTVKQFVHELGGEIEVKSEINKGTIFTVLLPFDIPLIEQTMEKVKHDSR